MSRRSLRTRERVCQLCDFITTNQSFLRRSLRAPKSTTCSRQFYSGRRLFLQNSAILRAQTAHKRRPYSNEATAQPQGAPEPHATKEELKTALQKARAACNALLESESIPSEADTIWALSKCEEIAKLIATYESPREDGAVSALLQLDESNKTRQLPPSQIPFTLDPIVNELSDLTYSIVKHSPVFISPKVLELYTKIQASLRRPQSLPEVFHLYANKPLPKEGSSPTRYKSQNPDKVGNAIPIPIADLALQSAISTKNLNTAMDLIETSYATKSFQRAKFVRKALLPATGLTVAPVAAYTVASQLAIMQTTMDTQMATNVAFTGLLAYLGFTATIGIVAITTSNDQMERVTWLQGLPLRERWIREEERAAIDQVAQAWGFKETWRRGEEEGQDWENLREWIAQRGMILDAAELMEGME